MSTQNWLTLMEYSAKYRVSISTLRRRIKAGEMEHQFTDGKYLLKDTPVTSPGTEVVAPPTSTQPQVQRNQDLIQTLQSPLSLVMKPASSTSIVAMVPPTLENRESKIENRSGEAKGSEINSTVETLLGEIKKAYALILQEKEEQILQLRSEVSDLKTLVRVLEEQSSHHKIADSNFDLDLEL